MKVIIDISKNDFLACKHWFNEGVAQWAEEIIANGTPLPENCEKLNEADEILEAIEDYYNSRAHCEDMAKPVNSAQIIVETNKGEENE